MNLPTLLNILLCSAVVYSIIIRVNMLHGPKQWTQRISFTMILIGMCYEGYAPLAYGYAVQWADLFLPFGLAIFFFRYVRKVERFFKQGLQ